MEQSTGLIVVGMHRSGTSALTGALHSLGANVGNSGELTGSSVENKKGFFERRDIRHICDALLHSADADWWKVSDFSTDQVEKAQLDQQRTKFSAIVENLSSTQSWVIKEPRLCLLLPLLVDLVSNPVCLLIYRNPIEVAKSLRTRNQIPLQQGLALWEAYNLAAIDTVKGRRCVVVSYHDLIADPVATLDNVVDQLFSSGVEGLRRPQDAADFIDKSLQRAVVQPDEMAMLTTEQRALWDFLEQRTPPENNTNLQPSPAQKFVLQDLEYYFASQTKAASGADPAGSAIRSRKVLKLARFLDRIALVVTSRIRR